MSNNLIPINKNKINDNSFLDNDFLEVAENMVIAYLDIIAYGLYVWSSNKDNQKLFLLNSSEKAVSPSSNKNWLDEIDKEIRRQKENYSFEVKSGCFLSIQKIKNERYQILIFKGYVNTFREVTISEGDFVNQVYPILQQVFKKKDLDVKLLNTLKQFIKPSTYSQSNKFVQEVIDKYNFKESHNFYR